MMEMDMIYRLSMMVGFLAAGFLALLIGGLICLLHSWYKSSLKELEDMLEDIEKLEEVCRDEK